MKTTNFKHIVRGVFWFNFFLFLYLKMTSIEFTLDFLYSCSSRYHLHVGLFCVILDDFLIMVYMSSHVNYIKNSHM